MSLYDYTAPQKIKEGVYTGVLTSHKPIENDKGGYIECHFNISNDEVTRNDVKYSLFPSYFDGFIDNMNTQLGIESRNLKEVLDATLNKPITMTFKWNKEDNRFYIYFYEFTPVVVESEDIEV